MATTTVKEAIMRMNNWILISIVAASTGACLPAHDRNKAPIAVIEASVAGQPVVQDQIVPFDGTAVTMTLNGSKSSDPDGHVTAWVWLRTDVTEAARNGIGAAGTGAAGAGAAGAGAAGAAAPAAPGPAFTGDPSPTQTTQVTLTERGKYRYTLWARDNAGVYSTPVSLRFQLGGFTPDAACAAVYMTPKADCKACACTANAMGGCLAELTRCFNNSDAMFTTLCSAVINCAVAKNCSGAACYTAALCMAEIDAASMYMGGTVATCSMAAMADANPCAASGAINTCLTTTSMCVDVCK